MLEYKGYRASFEVNDGECIHGEVINIRDVITFEGETIFELQKAFEKSVETYLEFCAAQGKEAEKPV